MPRAGTGVEATARAARSLALAIAVLWPLPSIAQECAKAEFEAVVEESAAALRELNQKNKPTFQSKLRALKDKRGWSHDQFLREAAPLVQDDTISDYDQRSQDLLSRITAMGQEGSAAKAPDCTLLKELHGHMRSLVEAQQAKWTYMFGRIDTELAR